MTLDPAKFTLDRASLLADVAGDVTLGALEDALAADGLTLGLADREPGEGPAWSTPVAQWIADGAPGARDRWADPADHLLAGLDAVLADGTRLRVHPSPRRAVGPDLVALFFGARGRFGSIARAQLRVHVRGARLPEAPPFTRARDPELTESERALLDAIARELGAATK